MREEFTGWHRFRSSDPDIYDLGELKIIIHLGIFGVDKMYSNLPIISAPSPLDRAQARLSDAVKKFEESYGAFLASSSKSKAPPIPSITLQQLSSCVSGADAAKSEDYGAFGHGIQAVMAGNVEKERLAQASKTADSSSTLEAAKRSLAKVGEFVTNLLPLAIVGCGVVAVIGDASIVSAPLKSVANGTALLLHQVQMEKSRREDLIVEMERISYQSRRVSFMQRYPAEKLNPLLREKCLGLLAEVVNFLTAAVKFWKHGMFRNVGRSLMLGPEAWKSSVAALHLAYEEYDQALLLQIAGNMMGKASIHSSIVFTIFATRKY